MDEKSGYTYPTSEEARESSRRNHRPLFHTVMVAVLLGTGYLLCSFAPDPYDRLGAEHAVGLGRLQDLPSANGPDSVWSRITPSEKLHWTTCYEDKECAKLSVPLDYQNPGYQASIALLRVPAKITPGEEEYKGPVLINPGGPGGSGTSFVRGRGKQLQTILGDGYDIVGFDPRGVGFTQPNLLLFNTAAEDAAWELRHEANPPLNATPDALARDVARWKVFGDLAQKRFQSKAEYVSTAMVSRDMLRITEAHGFEKVKYWGFSYGSVLGITFAAMFPDKVERLIVDGVCDTYDYYEAQWSTNLRDTDAALAMFYQACADAGSDECALHASDAAGVKERVDSIFSTLKKRPIPVHAQKNSTVVSNRADYGIVDYRMARHLTFQFLYAPYGRAGLEAAELARALAATERGDGRPLFDLASVIRQKEFRCNCDQDKDEIRQAQMDRETTMAIACSDGDVVNESIEELQAHYEGMAKMSSFAELWDLRIGCAGWKIRAKERFRGPFVGNTSHPILLIGNTADPVTPLWNARKMAIGFKDAAVLHQKSAGHCSLAAASLCTAKVVRNYFQHGQVPAANMECEVESRFFGEASKSSTAGINSDDAELLQALYELSHEFKAPMLHM